MNYYDVIIVIGERSTPFGHESLNPGKRNRGFAKQAVLRIKCQNAYIISARYEKVSCCKISPLQTISKIERVKV